LAAEVAEEFMLWRSDALHTLYHVQPAREVAAQESDGAGYLLGLHVSTFAARIIIRRRLALLDRAPSARAAANRIWPA
jgi:hypothetical protein